MSQVFNNSAGLVDPGLSRRGLLKAGVAFAAGSTLWSLAGSSARASTPKRGGVLRLALGHGATTDNYDPATFVGGFMIFLAYARYNCLTEIAPDGSLRPELAESWEVSSDAKTWVFNLRKGVEFQNGKTLDATDVIESINYHRDENSKSAVRAFASQIAEIKADGPNRVIVTLVAGNADFAYIFADFHLVIVPFIDGTLDWQSGLGTGGYVIQDFEPGVGAHLTRHVNYWKPDAAYFDAIDLVSVRDGAARQSALVSGGVDVIDRVELNQVHLLKRRSDIRIEEAFGSMHYTFAMDTRAAPFNDNNVRLALKYGIERQELVDKILSGHGTVGNDNPINSTYRYFAADLEQRTYDPDRARHHLKQAGLDKLSVALSSSDAAYSGAVDAALLYQEYSSKAGIEIEVVREPSDGYWSDVWMKKPFSAVYWRGRPTEDWMLSTAYAASASWNDTYWNNERFNEVLLAARVELDEAKRREMYYELQQLVRDDCGTVLPMFANYVGASSTRIGHHEQVSSAGDLDDLKLAERWWFN